MTETKPKKKTKELFVLEANRNSEQVFKKAYTIPQLDINFSRLYENTKDMEKIMARHRGVETNRLKPIGIYFYPSVNLSPEGIMKEVLTIHNKKTFWVLCSGGKDSMSVVHYIATNYPEQFAGVLHIKTGVGIKLTTEWLKTYCEEKGWPLEIRSPPEGTYRDIVLKVGFPNAGLHTIVMRLLKLITMRRFINEDPERKNNHALIGGIRAFESARRMVNAKTPISRDGSLFFVNPFLMKEDKWVYEYLITNGLKKTPVHDYLGMSGECMCGSFAGIGEREKIKFLDPELDEMLNQLEKDIQIYGSERAKKYPQWGKGYASKEEAEAIMNDLLTKEEKAKAADMEDTICGVECGSGTLRGLTNI